VDPSEQSEDKQQNDMSAHCSALGKNNDSSFKNSSDDLIDYSEQLKEAHENINLENLTVNPPPY
jgi:hypothetical protein